MQDFVFWFEEITGLGQDVQTRLFSTLIVILVLWLAHRLVIMRLVDRLGDTRARYQWYKTSGYLVFLAGLLIIGRIWFVGVQALATFLGLVSAGLAIALKDPITNLFGWIFIVLRRPFEIGDRIEIGDSAGDVIDIRIFQFSLMEIGNWVGGDQSTGRVLHVPNSLIFTNTLANFTKGSDYIWNEIRVLITFESNWIKAKDLLTEIALEYTNRQGTDIEKSFQDAARRYLLKYGTLTPKVYTSVEASGVLLTIRYLCHPHQRRGSSEELWEQILTAFSGHDDIDFAYPTQRFYNLAVEGNQQITNKNRSNI